MAAAIGLKEKLKTHSTIPNRIKQKSGRMDACVRSLFLKKREFDLEQILKGQ
jgi:hypothetical protein